MQKCITATTGATSLFSPFTIYLRNAGYMNIQFTTRRPTKCTITFFNIIKKTHLIVHNNIFNNIFNDIFKNIPLLHVSVPVGPSSGRTSDVIV
jgi:hypothetical protein